MLRLATILLALGLTRIAFAEPTAATITLQPVMLVMPMVDATIEVQPAAHVGVAARAGYGHVGIPFLAGASFYELGGAANYYVNRSFSGWHAGAEAFWLWGDTSGYLFDQQSQAQQGMSSPERIVGAYGGYKWVGWHGLTGVLQLGVGHLDQKTSPDGPIAKVIPVANMNAGWSF
jgi:hypothetical protein